LQGFDERSAATRELLTDPRFKKIGDISADGHVHTGLEGNAIEALIKPLDVVQGISDLPWHKDCSLGRHSFECCSLTVGISVTGAGEDSGQLRVIAGSHRALMWPSLLSKPEQYGLPIVELPTKTGDVTVHLSCTHHMSQAPTARERRVMYTSFRLPSVSVDSSNESRTRINQARELAYKTVSQ
jgi:ectoine hydroxylase-related dioxygenase (phytanoyl-CoA dioxygenase family)